MSPDLRVSDETFERLQKFTEPPSGTPEDALRKVLAIAEAHQDDKAADDLPTAARGAKPPDISAPTPPRMWPYQVRRRREDTPRLLERHDILIPGTGLVLLMSPDMSDPMCQATWHIRQSVVWKYDGWPYALSALTKHLRDAYRFPLPKGELNGYRYWGLADDHSRRSLWEIVEQSRSMSTE